MTQLIYTTGEKVLGIWLEGWIYPRGNLNTVEKRKFSAPARKQALIPCSAYRLIAILTELFKLQTFLYVLLIYFHLQRST
jgi:hypothetical protein